MSVQDELLAAVRYVRDRTGDPNAWQAGLAPDEVVVVANPTTRPDQLDAILRKIRGQHPDLFGVQTPAAPPPGPPADREQGNAAEAIARAEAALAQQNSASSQLDMQVITAILNAHLKTVEGKEALSNLQRETEAAVQTRSDLDTPAGARDFQRFLIGKLRDIRAVVLEASLDDTSKSALMAAWTSLYDASKNESDPGEQSRAPAAPAGEDDSDTGWNPLLDPVPADDVGLAPEDESDQVPSGGAPAPPMPAPQAMPSVPGLGSAPLPGLGAVPGSMSGWGLPLSGLQDGGTSGAPGLDDEPGAADRDPNGRLSTDEPNGLDAEQQVGDPSPSVGPTTITLPDGETVTAANPQLAAAIKAAVGGVPIADAFRQQGITIPPPGAAVAEPIEPPRLAPGDIGIFTDRHALALGPKKALLDGRIQHIATVSGPTFLGWEHPPAPTATASAPATPDTTTPPGTPTHPEPAPTTTQ